MTHAPTIAEHLMIDTIQNDGNAIIDSDHINIEATNRARLRKRAIEKLVELLDRIPYHYEWKSRDGGVWLRKT